MHSSCSPGAVHGYLCAQISMCNNFSQLSIHKPSDSHELLTASSIYRVKFADWLRDQQAPYGARIQSSGHSLNRRNVAPSTNLYVPQARYGILCLMVTAYACIAAHN